VVSLTEIKYKSEYKGKGGIIARVVDHSKSAYSGKEIVTFEYESPKCILAETNTHRALSRNAQSSRAVPIAKVIEGIRNSPATPIYWGSNQAGMVAGEEINAVPYLGSHYNSDNEEYVDNVTTRDEAWEFTADQVADLMQAWDNAGYHKQIVNRIGEAFTMIKGVITATELDNFFHLRRHPAADPFMKELADCMWEALQLSTPEILHEGEWHTPYVRHSRNALSGVIIYWQDHPTDAGVMRDVTPERALQISS
jgi:thymidylate synthase ThyX